MENDLIRSRKRRRGGGGGGGGAGLPVQYCIVGTKLCFVNSHVCSLICNHWQLDYQCVCWLHSDSCLMCCACASIRYTPVRKVLAGPKVPVPRRQSAIGDVSYQYLAIH